MAEWKNLENFAFLKEYFVSIFSYLVYFLVPGLKKVDNKSAQYFKSKSGLNFHWPCPKNAANAMFFRLDMASNEISDLILGLNG
jgi:hypothetical protein